MSWFSFNSTKTPYSNIISNGNNINWIGFGGLLKIYMNMKIKYLKKNAILFFLL